MNKIIELFKLINSETSLMAFGKQFNLKELASSNGDRKYEGCVDVFNLEMNQHSCDHSQAFSIQKDSHSVILKINGQEKARVDFEGDA